MPRGKPISEEEISRIISVLKNQIKLHKNNEIEQLVTLSELCELSGLGTTSISKICATLPEELKSYRLKCSRTLAGKIGGQKVGKMNVKKGIGIFTLSHDQMVENSKKGAEIVKRERLGMFAASNEQRIEWNKKGGNSTYIRNLGVHSRSKEQIIAQARIAGRIGGAIGGKINGRKRAENNRKDYYNIERRFYSHSQQEGAVSLMLENYVEGYQVTEEVNFQVRDKGMNNGGIDFLVNGEFLEWHPIQLFFKRRGDIPSEEEYNQFKATLESLVDDEKKEFQDQYKEILSINYLAKRQADVDNSEYNGSRVYLARDVEELYEFMQRHTDQLPQLDEFKREFKEKIKYVKRFKVERKAKAA